VVALDRGIAKQMEEAFTADLGHATRVTEDLLHSLSLLQKFRDTVCYWIRAQL
jgi:hypothetical protein